MSTEEEARARAYRIHQQSYADQRLAREKALAGGKAAYAALLAAWVPLTNNGAWSPVERVVEPDPDGYGGDPAVIVNY